MTAIKVATLEEARAAKQKAAQVLSGLPLAGIGITRVGEGFGLKVNLSKRVCVEQMPTQMDGVPIIAEVVGEIRKQ